MNFDILIFYCYAQLYNAVCKMVEVVPCKGLQHTTINLYNTYAYQNNSGQEQQHEQQFQPPPQSCVFSAFLTFLLCVFVFSGMDFIDDVDSSDEEDIFGTGGERNGQNFNQQLNTVFIELMKLKPFLKAQKTDILTTEIIIPKEICIISNSDVSDDVRQSVDSVSNKLKSAKFKVANLSTDQFNSTSDIFDIVVNVETLINEVESTNSVFIEKMLISLMPGGKLLTFNSNINIQESFNEFDWIVEPTNIINHNASTNKSVYIIQKRCVHCNQNGAIYWRDLQNKTQIENERSWIEKVCVPITVCEYKTGVFSDTAHKRSVNNILTYGVCIFPHLFNTTQTMSWGGHAKNDMRSIVQTLQSTRGIDLLNPSPETPRIENFHELSMREALRCDLRNGRQMKKKTAEIYSGSNVKDNTAIGVNVVDAVTNTPNSSTVNNTSRSTAPSQPSATTYHKHAKATNTSTNQPVDYHTHLSAADNIRYHPAVLSVLGEAMNPPAGSEHERRGNWGRYNFEGAGPEVVPQPKIGQLGVVMSLPGCADQTIHADTSHIFVHTHLPPHYLNLFTPAVERETNAIKQHKVESKSKSGAESKTVSYESYDIGQTSFVVGSHTLDVCGRVMTTSDGQALLEERLIRPQLSVGDALIFDCRVLHFGLANQSPMVDTHTVLNSESDEAFSRNSSGWRPMLYVNYHHDWFHDPKNWNDAERLFKENSVSSD